MFGLGVPELLVIFGVVLLMFGGNKLPKLGSSLGEAMRNFKRGMNDLESGTKEEDTKVERERLPAAVNSPAPVAQNQTQDHKQGNPEGTLKS